MLKNDIVLGQEVSVRGKGRGTVIDLCPNLLCYVKLRYISGNEEMADVLKIRPALSPTIVKDKLTGAQKARIWADDLRRFPLIWAVAGHLASSPSTRITASAPEHLWAETSGRLSEYGVQHSFGSTLTGEANRIDGTGLVRGAQGASFCVVTDNFGVADFLKQTGVHASIYQEEGATLTSAKKLSMQKWEFVLVFLLSDLKFRLSAKDQPNAVQDINAIRSLVPACHLGAFDSGCKGEFSRYLGDIAETKLQLVVNP
jgi:hypothetical protein